ncbi:hypothetical protein ACJRO7_014724 [Eucalyptus globulus]|uniref:Tropomyosin n=1 Tax=Eucalyptus globulus TaxID=34317 RepID=A0ABD3L4Y5_EUCGL
MSLSATFGEWLEQLNRTRNQLDERCWKFLQAKRESCKPPNRWSWSRSAAIRSMEERCLKLEWSLALQSLKISALESKIAALDAKYDNNVQRLRELKCEVEELEEAEKEKDGFYRAQTGEMKDFKEATNGFVVDCQIRIEELRDELNEVKEKLSIFGSVS